MSKLAELVARVRDTGLGVSLTIAAGIPELPASLDLAAYRIVQESLTNAMKHGGPVAYVDVSCTSTDLYIEVTDDGPAADAIKPVTGPLGGSSGQGLIGMRERVAVYNGDFSAGPRPTGGFRVACRLPLAGVGGVDHQRASSETVA